MIRVDPGAQRTDAFQESRNLLLSTDGPRRRDPGPRDRGRRRPLHARRGGRPGRPPSSSTTCARTASPTTEAKRLVIEGFLQELVERANEGPIRDDARDELERASTELLGAA